MEGKENIFFDFAKHDKQDTDHFQGLGYFKCYCEKITKITGYIKP